VDKWLDDSDPAVRAERARFRETKGNGKAKRSDQPRRFKITRFKDIELKTDLAYLIKEIIPREGLVVAWGPPKCGKSFWVYDAGLHIALGWEYRGRRVQQGTVVYVACEGERGLGARAAAFRQQKLTEGSDTDPPFFLLTTKLDLVADVETLIADVKAGIGADHCAAIVIDTLNRSIVGSESKDEDMGAYVKAADLIRENFNCTVIIIHHCGINGERPRGHTSLTGAVDAQIAVKRDADDRIIATVEFMKDGPEGDEIVSRLAVVEVGTDEDGESITSCTIEAADGEGRPIRSNRLPDAAQIALDTLRKAIAEAGQQAPTSNHIPTAARVVDVETWRFFHYAGTASDGQTAEARKKSFQRVRQKAQAHGVVGIHADLCWVVADV
jgi:hypothetical protein